MVESVKVKRERSVFSVEKGTALPDYISRLKLSYKSLLVRIDEKMWGKRPIWKRTKRFT
ncbi:MAG: hypothetical protein GQ536_10210 [Candidatus Aminicenantes bacterium]|nr:hypothetical protein [Candidatus Aminicenantes bacterium]